MKISREALIDIALQGMNRHSDFRNSPRRRCASDNTVAIRWDCGRNPGGENGIDMGVRGKARDGLQDVSVVMEMRAVDRIEDEINSTIGRSEMKITGGSPPSRATARQEENHNRNHLRQTRRASGRSLIS